MENLVPIICAAALVNPTNVGNVNSLEEDSIFDFRAK
jgi:hypothetical protein